MGQDLGPPVPLKFPQTKSWCVEKSWKNGMRTQQKCGYIGQQNTWIVRHSAKKKISNKGGSLQ